MALVIGGAEEDEKLAGKGGFIGGIGIGILIMFANLAIFTRIDTVANADMPLLKLVDEISPILGFIKSVLVFGMIFITAVSMFYTLVTRVFAIETHSTHIPIIIHFI